MTTILVWVAILYTGDYRGGYAVVDNIATQADCERIVRRGLKLNAPYADFARGNCTQYRKVVAK